MVAIRWLLQGLVVLAVLASAMSASASPTRGRPGVGSNDLTLSASPSSLQVLAAPCGARTIDVGVRNEGSEPVYGDVVLTPESPLTVSPDLISSYFPPGYELVVPVSVRAPAGSAEGEYEVRLRAGRTGKGDELVIPVTVTTPPDGPDANLALAASVSASSTHGNFAACGAIDGNRNQDDWDVLTGWNDGTPEVFPDWLAVTFPQPEQVSRVDLYTLDSTRYPGSRYGLRDFDVQVLESDGSWRTVASVRDNTLGLVSSTFDPVSTTSVRVLALASNDARYSRIVELEVYRE